MNQLKMYRCIKMIEFLENKSRPIYVISRYLDVCERTVYRYFKLFEALGYKVEKDNYSKYKLIKEK